MIEYRCPKCDVRCEQSTCPSCGSRADSKASIFWCENCNVPIWNEVCDVCGTKGKYISTDIRPVFPQERLLFEILLGKPMAYANDSVWHIGSRYVVNGKTVVLPGKIITTSDSDDIRKQLSEYAGQNQRNCFDSYIQKWIQCNHERYQYITIEAMHAIQAAATSFTPANMFVSFSGGKDSTVTSDLVIRALGNPSIIHLYGDTTLEFPDSERYVKRFRENNRKTPFLISRNNDKNFYEMCDIIGPPSRVKRWCCTIFKTGAITKKIEKTFPGVKTILSFQGIRRNESNSRNKYDRMSRNSKISKQVMFSPVIDWLDSDIWLYILTTGIDFNDAYRYGYTRVGCWCCPNNSGWSEFLSSIYMPEQHKAWQEQLIAFAKKVGKPDPEEYVSSGSWKARQGGNGLDVSKRFVISFRPCATDETSFNYSLIRPISEELYELFKPFGNLNFELGNTRLGEVFVMDRNDEPLLKIQGRIGKNDVRITILKLPLARAKRLHEAEMKIKCQLAKYQICLGCNACTSVCKHDAIRITPGPGEWHTIKINNNACIHCGECINHFDGGCYMRDVIRTSNK